MPRESARERALSSSVNVRYHKHIAVISITHTSHEPIKYGFGGTQISSGGRQKKIKCSKNAAISFGYAVGLITK